MNVSVSPANRVLVTPFAMAFTVMMCCATAISRGQKEAAADQAISVQRAYKADDVDFYRITIVKKINGAQTNNKDYELKMVIAMKETTKTVRDNGDVAVIDEYTKADGTFDGQEMNIMPMMPKLTLSKDKSGPITVSPDGGQEPWVTQISGLAKALMQSQVTLVPTKPVKVGDTWSSVVGGLTPDDNTTTRVTIKLDGVELVGGVKTLRLKTTSDTSGGPSSDTKVHGDGTAYLDAVSGKTVKISSKSRGTEKGSTVTTEILFEKSSSEDSRPPRKEAAPK